VLSFLKTISIQDLACTFLALLNKPTVNPLAVLPKTQFSIIEKLKKENTRVPTPTKNKASDKTINSISVV
jgi:hypothetical protein